MSVGVLTLIFSIYNVQKSALYGFDRVAVYVRLELIGSALAIGSTVVVIAAGWHAYLMPLALGYATLVAGAWIVLRPRVAGAAVPVPRAQRREMAGYIALASVGGIAASGLLQALPLLAGIFTTHTEVEQLVTAVALVAPLYFLPRALSMALFPALAHAHGAGDLESVRRQADLSTRGLFVLLAPLFAAAVVLSRIVLTVVYGQRFAAGALILQVILLATFLMVTQVAAVNTLSSGSAREVRIPVTSAVLGGVAGIASAVPLGIAFAGRGVAFAYLIAAAISAIGPLVAVARKFEMGWLGPITRSVTVVIGAVVVGVLIGEVTDSWLIDVAGAVVTTALAVLVLRGDLRAVLSARR